MMPAAMTDELLQVLGVQLIGNGPALCCLR